MLHRWWDGHLPESFWMEITDLSDLGVDLKAPVLDSTGAEKWTYALIREVSPGDVVVHWSTPERATVGWSIADGECWEEPIVWAAHGTSARTSGVTPFARPGLRRALTSYRSLAEAVIGTVGVVSAIASAMLRYGPGGALLIVAIAMLLLFVVGVARGFLRIT